MRDILRNPQPLDGFEPFTPQPKAPTVRFHPTRTMTFNAASYAAMGSPTRVELLWNEERDVLALRPTSAETDATVSVRITNTSSAYIPLTALFRTLGINLTKSVQIPLGITDGITFIDLSDMRT